MDTNTVKQPPVQQRRRRISRQEMLRRKRAIRRRKRIARCLRISVAIVLLLTAVSFWQDYGSEILPAVNHLYYQLTARYDLPVPNMILLRCGRKMRLPPVVLPVLPRIPTVSRKLWRNLWKITRKRRIS